MTSRTVAGLRSQLVAGINTSDDGAYAVIDLTSAKRIRHCLTMLEYLLRKDEAAEAKP